MKAQLSKSALGSESTQIISADQLRLDLEKLAEEKPQVVELRLDSGATLTIGVGGAGGFAQFTNESGEPPYLVARDSTPLTIREAYLEFDAGGTLTPIEATYCLEVPRVLAIAEYFLEHQRPFPEVNWDEV